MIRKFREAAEKRRHNGNKAVNKLKLGTDLQKLAMGNPKRVTAEESDHFRHAQIPRIVLRQTLSPNANRQRAGAVSNIGT